MSAGASTVVVENSNGVEPDLAPLARTRAEERTAARNRKKKQHRKEVKRQQRAATDSTGAAVATGREGQEASGNADVAEAANGVAGDGADSLLESSAPAVVVEYVSRREEVADDPAFQDIARAFEHFSTAEELLGAKAVAEAEDAHPVDGSDGHPDLAGGPDDGEAEGEEGQRMSKRRQRKDMRMGLAELKRSTDRPEAVEQWDVTSADPKLLVHLKALRNVVPVPVHWSQKRAFLQGKRGVEKKPFQLPDFIAATGIEKIRQAVTEKEEAKRAKQKSREATRPKMNRIDLDYQVLHDAFFKYQTKPQLTGHGDLYYEGRENEVQLREKRPGQLSTELRLALNMGDDPLAPPPWLVNMQRYGPPPSYPLLRVPGLNAPLPEGASYGNHPGGWGKPPVDESGQPLYGSPFDPPVTPPHANGAATGGGPAGKPWGEPDSDVDEESESDLDEGAGAEPELTPSEVDRGTASVSSLEPGTETPGVMQLRKDRPAGTDTPSSVVGGPAAPVPVTAEPQADRPLYSVLEQQPATVGSATFGSAHTYKLPPQAGGGASKPKPKLGGVEVALDPAELEHLDEETLRRRYEAQAKATKRNNAHEDLSDMVQEHEARKRQKQEVAEQRKRATGQ